MLRIIKNDEDDQDEEFSWEVLKHVAFWRGFPMMFADIMSSAKRRWADRRKAQKRGGDRWWTKGGDRRSLVACPSFSIFPRGRACRARRPQGPKRLQSGTRRYLPHEQSTIHKPHAPRAHGARLPLGSPLNGMSRQVAPENPVPAAMPVDGGVEELSLPALAPVPYDEPVVTRKELWSYYSVCCPSLCRPAMVLIRGQCTTTATMASVQMASP
jgi:hypothetical protein